MSFSNMASTEDKKDTLLPLRQEWFEWKTFHIQNPVRDAP